MISEYLFNIAIFICFLPSQAWEYIFYTFVSLQNKLAYVTPVFVLIQLIWIIGTGIFTVAFLLLSALFAMCNI